MKLLLRKPTTALIHHLTNQSTHTALHNSVIVPDFIFSGRDLNSYSTTQMHK